MTDLVHDILTDCFQAAESGGALSVGSASLLDPSLTQVKSSVFESNSAVRGAAVAITFRRLEFGNASFTSNNCSFVSNIARQAGGK